MENLAEIIWAIAGLVTIAGIVFLIAKGLIGKLTFRAGPIEAKVDMTALHQDIKVVKESLEVLTTEVKNGKPKTLVERVDSIDAVQKDMYQEIAWQGEILEKVAHHVGFKPEPRRERTERTREGDHK